MFSDCKTLKEAKTRWRSFASQYHPDRGGNAQQFHEAKQAYDEIVKKLSDPVKCPRCKGKGKVLSTSGFNTLFMPCRRCGGTGKLKREDL